MGAVTPPSYSVPLATPVRRIVQPFVRASRPSRDAVITPFYTLSVIYLRPAIRVAYLFSDGYIWDRTRALLGCRVSSMVLSHPPERKRAPGSLWMILYLVCRGRAPIRVLYSIYKYSDLNSRLRNYLTLLSLGSRQEAAARSNSWLRWEINGAVDHLCAGSS